MHSALSGSYDLRLVTLSVVIAVVSAYAALDLAGRVTATKARLRSLWLSFGAVAMGIGIWAMHYIGMEAYSLPVKVLYDLPAVLLSLLAAVLASAIALFVAGRSRLTPGMAAAGGLLMGAGIAGMDYIGMAAMRLPATPHYNQTVLAISVVLAVAASLAALWITFRHRSARGAAGWRKAGSALLMGLAIPAVHYTAMAAVTFTPAASAGDISRAVDISELGAVGIGAVTLTILALAIMTSIVDRRFSEQSLELERSEQRYRELVDSAKVILWRGRADLSTFSFVNQEAELLLGYPQGQWLATRAFWMDHIHPGDRQLAAAHCAEAAKGTPQRFEHRMVTARSETIWLRTSVRLVDNARGNELVGVMTDITERKRAQAEVERLNRELSRENSRMSAELHVTRRLQQMILPRDEDLQAFRNLDLAGFMEPATEVGGDYYDVVGKDGGAIFCIGDVTGHGLESGVIAIMVQTAVRTLLASGYHDSRRFFEILNRVIYDNVRHMNADRNLTFNLLKYQDKHLVISGQHEEVLVVRRDGRLERHDTLNLGFPLGLEENISGFIAEAKVPLDSGDVMVVYTDGVTEAVNSAGAVYGVERLCRAIVESSSKTAQGIREAVLKSLKQFTGGSPQLDDISLLVVKPT